MNMESLKKVLKPPVALIPKKVGAKGVYRIISKLLTERLKKVGENLWMLANDFYQRQSYNRYYTNFK